MSSMLLSIPDHIYDQAERIAKATAQPIETVLLTHLAQSFEKPFALLPEAEQNELHALNYLSDEALWTIAREKMPADKQHQMQRLMDKNNFGEITESEYRELSELVEQGQKLMLRKAQAAALLTRRGYTVTSAQMDE